MNVSRVIATAATAMSVLAVIGCTSTQPAPEVAAAPVAPPEQVVVAPMMPAQPMVQNEPPVAVVVINEPPVVVAQAQGMTTPAAEFTERAPKADRN
jgi:hypothetical protein